MKKETVPLVIQFAEGSRVTHEETVQAPLPETFVEFPNGLRVQVPTDQVVAFDRQQGHARVGLGGMTFEGIEEGRLVFWRVRDMVPEDRMPAWQDEKMTLAPETVASVLVQGKKVWPKQASASI